MSGPLGIGVVGLGLAGSMMIEAIKRHPSLCLAAAVEPQHIVRDRFADVEKIPVYEHLEDALGNSAIDIIYLATPPQFHRGQALIAIAAGKHVLVEKPMALTSEDCEAMARAAESFSVALVVGHTHGFDPGVALLAELVRSATYGPPGLLAMWAYTNFLYRPRRPDELNPATGGGVIFNQVAHQVDVARTILGRPILGVKAVATRLDKDRPVDGSCTALLDFGQNISATLVYAGYDHFDTDELHGWITESGHKGAPRHGSARARLNTVPGANEAALRTESLAYGSRKLTSPDHQPHLGELVVTCAGADLRLGEDSVLAYTDTGRVEFPVGDTGGWPAHTQALQEIVDAIRGKRLARHDGHFGATTVRVCEAIAASAAAGAEVVLDSLKG